ncbi:MAG: hypothetical protein WBW69_05595 [Candidatus Korobacteraceae bacterium]
MRGLTYFAAMMALFAAMIFAQSSTSASSDQSNSSQSSAQSQDQTNSDASGHSSRDKNASRMHDHHADNSAPDTTVRTPATNEPSTMTRPSDQQPNSSTSSSSPQAQAYLMQTPAARAVATHTPDPGTCMNPAALQAAENSNQPRPGPPCD